jgi:hypothetical protein
MRASCTWPAAGVLLNMYIVCVRVLWELIHIENGGFNVHNMNEVSVKVSVIH